MFKAQKARVLTRIHFREQRSFSQCPLTTRSQPLLSALKQYLRSPVTLCRGPSIEHSSRKCAATSEKGMNIIILKCITNANIFFLIFINLFLGEFYISEFIFGISAPLKNKRFANFCNSKAQVTFGKHAPLQVHHAARFAVAKKGGKQ